MQDLSWIKARWPEVQRVSFKNGAPIGAATIFNDVVYALSRGIRPDQSEDEAYAVSELELRETISDFPADWNGNLP